MFLLLTIGGSTFWIWLGVVEFSWVFNVLFLTMPVASCHLSHGSIKGAYDVYISQIGHVSWNFVTRVVLCFFSVVSQKCQTKRSKYFLLCTHSKLNIVSENPFLLGRYNFRGEKTLKLRWAKMDYFCVNGSPFASISVKTTSQETWLHFPAFKLLFFWSLYMNILETYRLHPETIPAVASRNWRLVW